MATQLIITPNFSNKTSIVTGSIAVGEKVSLTIIGAGDFVSGLRVRIRYAQTEVAMFPLRDTGDVWTSDGSNATGTIDLNSIEFRSFFAGLDERAKLPCILIVENNDVPENLYAVTSIAVMNWSAVPGHQVPFVLGEWKNDLAEVQSGVTALEEAVLILEDFRLNHAHTDGNGHVIAHGNLSGVGTNTHAQIDGLLLTLQNAMNAYAGAVTTHKDRKDNPHKVDAAQLELENVDNTSDLDKPISELTQAALNLKLEAEDLEAHTERTGNVHSLTSTHLGLGNVDNTRDMDKPLSFNMLSALEAKASIASLNSHKQGRDDPHETIKKLNEQFWGINEPFTIDDLFDAFTQVLNTLKGW